MKEIILNLSNDSITTNENVSKQITRQEFWKRFLYLTNQELSDKESEVLSCYLSDVELGRVPATVYKSLETKGLLIDKQLNERLLTLKEKLVFNKYRFVFNYELHDIG